MIRPRFWRRLINPLNLGGLGWLAFATLLTAVLATLWRFEVINWPWWVTFCPVWATMLGVVLAALGRPNEF